jgi:aminoglycoside phosphotransferase (APT) family kinase protein
MADIERFVREHSGVESADLRLEITPLAGGLMSDSVAHVRAHLGAAHRRRLSFVAKRLTGSSREAAVYAHLHAGKASPSAPQLYGLHQHDDGVDMYIEAVRPARRWPWPDERLASRVLEHLAALHRTDATAFAAAVPEWNYAAELEVRAARTVEAFDTATQPGWRAAALRRHGRPLRRLASQVGRVHRFLVEAAPFGPTVIHGDVHPGNVIARRSGGRLEPVLIDWERARVGSGLEDVASWLQSLGFWDVETRRRHDTLLATYLAALGLPPDLDERTRDLYWLAAGCNALSGALEYHMAVVTDLEATPVQQYLSLTAARRALQVIRQADARWPAVQQSGIGALDRFGTPVVEPDELDAAGLPDDLGQAAVAGPPIAPPAGGQALYPAEDLADHAGVRDHEGA